MKVSITYTLNGHDHKTYIASNVDVSDSWTDDHIKEWYITQHKHLLNVGITVTNITRCE